MNKNKDLFNHTKLYGQNMKRYLQTDIKFAENNKIDSSLISVKISHFCIKESNTNTLFQKFLSENRLNFVGNLVKKVNQHCFFDLVLCVVRGMMNTFPRYFS